MKIINCLCLVFFIFISCSDYSHRNTPYSEIIDIKHTVASTIFDRPEKQPDFDAMLNSFAQIDNLYIMTFHGNFDELILYHHQQIMQYFSDKQNTQMNNVYCSLFTYKDKTNTIYFGRNFDNRESDLLIGLFIPDSGYTSIGFIPMIEFKFDEQHPFDSASAEHRRVLLHSAAATVDGMNEKGVTVSVASVQKQAVIADSTKPYRFLLHLKRNILDHAFDVNSAIEIASRYNVFDNSQHHISHHILIADSSGKSVVLEWHKGEMQVIPDQKNRLIVTNSPLFNVSNEHLSRTCRRYRSIYSNLQESPDTLSWQQSMDLLFNAMQVNNIYTIDHRRMTVSTQWSAVFEINKGIINVCQKRRYEKVYRFRLHNKDFYKQNVTNL